jgi:hypothetical protein
MPKIEVSKSYERWRFIVLSLCSVTLNALDGQALALTGRFSLSTFPVTISDVNFALKTVPWCVRN